MAAWWWIGIWQCPDTFEFTTDTSDALWGHEAQREGAGWGASRLGSDEQAGMEVSAHHGSGRLGLESRGILVAVERFHR